MNVPLVPTAIGLAVVLALGAQAWTIRGLHTQLAQERQSRAEDAAARTRLVSQYETKLSKKEQTHAQEQQTSLERFDKERLAWAGERNRDVNAARMRSAQIAKYTGAGPVGTTDALALQRCTDRLSRVGALLDEGQGLVTEAVGIVERRDSEVSVLARQIEIDRAACSTPP